MRFATRIAILRVRTPTLPSKAVSDSAGDFVTSTQNPSGGKTASWWPNSPGSFALYATAATSASVSASFCTRTSFVGARDGLEGALVLLRAAAFAGA
jgi:hypothetical protein